MPQFDDLTPQLAVRYVREKLSLFPRGAALHVHEIDHAEGEGYVNHLYRVWDDFGHDVLVKQAKPYFSFYGPDAGFSVTVARNQVEADSYGLRAAIVPQYLLPIYVADAENNLFVQEYWSRPTVRTLWRNGVPLPDFPEMIGEYVAKTYFYTSEIFLDQSQHHELAGAFTNAPMRRILEDVLFDLSPFGDETERRRWLGTHFDYLPGRMADDALVEEVLALRDTYLKRADVLVHGDLHTSNMMMDPVTGRLVVFDHEYTHMGAYSTDLGYLLGNFLFPCIAFRFRHDLSPAERDRGGRVPLHQAVEVMDAFFRHFRACWAADAKPLYRDRPAYMDRLFAGLIPEVAGLMGLQAMDRIFGPGAMQDYELIADGPDLEEARLLTVLVTQTLIMCRHQLTSMADVVALVEDTLARYDAR